MASLYYYRIYTNGHWIRVTYPSGVASIAFKEGEEYMSERFIIAPVAVYRKDFNTNVRILEYYRDCSPDLIAALLKGKG